MKRWGVMLGLLVACNGKSSDPVVVRHAHLPYDAPRAQVCDPRDHQACGDDTTLVECTPEGQYGQPLQTCPGGCRRAACVATCAVQGVELIYLVDERSRLLSFDPSRLPGDPFTLIGTIHCPGTADASPFSMAVDRSGIAWVIYNNGYLHRVSIVDAKCQPDGAPPGPNAPSRFGMGFVTDGPSTSTESLIATSADDNVTFARIDTRGTPTRWEPLGKMSPAPVRNPELTGLANGQLFGYFPAPGHGFVQQLDLKTGELVGRPLAVGGDIEDVEAYAFAQWGGYFYVFASGTGNTVVYSIRRSTGAFKTELETTPYRIVGAGVSTCAPELEKAQFDDVPALPGSASGAGAAAGTGSSSSSAAR